MERLSHPPDPQTPDPTAPLDARSVLPMIQGLTRLHDHVALVDGAGRIAWLSDGLASACGGARRFKGRSWLELLAEPRRVSGWPSS